MMESEVYIVTVTVTVIVTTFYAVTLLRHLFSTDPPSTDWYKEFTTVKERIPQIVFAEITILALVISAIACSLLVDELSFMLYMLLFAISLFTGGIGLVQLSDKFRMEMWHAYFTLFWGCLCCLAGIYNSIYGKVTLLGLWSLLGAHQMAFFCIPMFNFTIDEYV